MILLLICIALIRWRTLVVLTVIAVGMMVVIVAVVSLVIPAGMLIPIGMVLTPIGVALFWMPIAIAEVRMVIRMVVAILIAVRATQTRSEKEQSGEGQRDD
jgi:hypothetical protein